MQQPVHRLHFLKALVAAAPLPPHSCDEPLGATLAQLAHFGGRDGMPLSLASVAAGAVALFLPRAGYLNQRIQRISFASPNRRYCRISMWWDLAVSVDGSYVFYCFEQTVRVYRTCDGALERTLGDNELHTRPGTFFLVSNVAVAPDDYVFVFDGCGVEVFSPMPHLRLHTAFKYPHPHPSYVYADVSRLYIKCYADSEIMVLSSDTGAVLR
jgi:hypothetical protein